MVARMLRQRGLATFILLVVVAEVTGRSLTRRVDRLLHVRSLANVDTSYYPFLLVGVKVVGALALAALLARATRAHAAADAADRLIAALGHRHETRTRLRPRLSFRVWLGSFAATSGLYLVHADIEGAAAGRWPLLAPVQHGYALPVFAVLAVFVALAWRCARWLHDIEDYAERTLARVQRILVGALRLPVRHLEPSSDSAPRRRFGLAFESRPPPLIA